MDDRSEIKAHLWRPAAWLRVAGPDALHFLQGQFTNDLGVLERIPAVYGLWLEQKGHVLGDSFVLRAGQEAFWIGSYFSTAEVLRLRLETYIIADDVIITDETSAWAGLSLIGPTAESAAREFAAPVQFAGRRVAESCVEILFAAETVPAIGARLETLRWPRLAGPDMERLRIQAGIAAVPQDIGPRDLPNEGGLDAVAISYTKGCYLGQEVMARLKSMGRVRRQLKRVTGPGAAPAVPAPLFQGEKKIGELRSAAETNGSFIGMAMLTTIGLDPRTGFAFAASDAPTLQLAESDAKKN